MTFYRHPQRRRGRGPQNDTAICSEEVARLASTDAALPEEQSRPRFRASSAPFFPVALLLQKGAVACGRGRSGLADEEGAPRIVGLWPKNTVRSSLRLG